MKTEEMHTEVCMECLMDGITWETIIDFRMILKLVFVKDVCKDMTWTEM